MVPRMSANFNTMSGTCEVCCYSTAVCHRNGMSYLNWVCHFEMEEDDYKCRRGSLKAQEKFWSGAKRKIFPKWPYACFSCDLWLWAHIPFSGSCSPWSAEKHQRKHTLRQEVSSWRDEKVKCLGHHRGTLSMLLVCEIRIRDAELELASPSCT